MSDFFEKIKRTAYDLTQLEINTIIKSEMSAVSLPDNNRVALHFLATKYAMMLQNIGTRYKDCSAVKSLYNPFRGHQHWKFSGRRSFRELRERAKEAIKTMSLIDHKETIKLNISETEVNRDTMLLERIWINSIQIVNLFEEVRKEYYKQNKLPFKETDWPDKDMENDNTSDLIYDEHLESKEWNNDLKIETINQLPDLDLDLRQRLLVRKALDIGSEEIVMQSIIGLDGDVTTRILEKFANNPNDLVLNIHNESIRMSVGYWNKIIETLVALGKNIIDKIK